MKHTISISLACLLAASGVALADEHAMGQNSMHGMQSMQNPEAHTHTGTGTVNKVDLQNGKVNLTHEPIQSLNWPGMTMNFKVKDKAMLKGIQPGQKVEFDLMMEKSGLYHIERIAPLK